jgi:hypothetical protein
MESGNSAADKLMINEGYDPDQHEYNLKWLLLLLLLFVASFTVWSLI